MIRSLFLKIFLWFWCAMILMVIAITWSTTHLRESEVENIMAQAYRTFEGNSRQAVDVLQKNGLDGLRQWLRQPDHQRALSLYVLDMDGRQRLGKAMPPQLRRHLHNIWQQAQQGPRWLRMHVITPPGGGMPLRLITVFSRPSPLKLLFTGSRIALALLVSGLVCFWLARHITRPVRQLRQATRALSTGRLEIRVATLVGRRHDEIASLADDFDHMAARLQSLLTSQQQLIRDISHELRSPLARLQVALELARQRGTQGNEKELDRIEREAERLNELIGQMLSLSRMETQQQGLQTSEIALDKLLETIVRDADFEARAHHCQVRLLPGPHCKITANEPLLHSAIENIVRNAIKYTAPGSQVELQLQAPEAGSPSYHIRVRDHGPGVPEHLLPELFKPFFRVSEARDRDSGGYGLGLTIAERAVRLHGGTIRAANAQGGGLAITLCLPEQGPA